MTQYAQISWAVSGEPVGTVDIAVVAAVDITKRGHDPRIEAVAEVARDRRS